MSAAAAPLLAFLHDLQERSDGAIPVETYVREALYHPEHGYYSNHIRTVGRRGDFATSATLGRALAQAVARWIGANRVVSPVDGRCHVIEIGAGSGELAATVLRQLGWLTRRSITYHIVETSPVLRGEQRERLGSRATWHPSLPEALTASHGHALIFSNELIDAFPPRVFERRDSVWLEVAVRIDGTSLSEVLVERPTPTTSALTHPYPDGQRVEVHAAAAEWLLTWAPLWKAGQSLTIDYGQQLPELYHRRPRGTLRAYFHHQRYDGLAVYHRFGRQDITADVNFTDLEAWGRRLGWQTHALTTQAEFLAQFGSRNSRVTPHDADLADISGTGAAFQTLIQSPEANPSETPQEPWLERPAQMRAMLGRDAQAT